MGLSIKVASVPRPKLADVELDLGRYELRRLGRRVKLEKKPMELLIFLVRRRDQLVSRQDIMDQLWHSDLFIDTERNVNNIVRKIRRALGDRAGKPRFLETVIGKGYRFIGPVRVISPLYPSTDLREGAGGNPAFSRRRDLAARTAPRSSCSRFVFSGGSRMIRALPLVLRTPRFRVWRILRGWMSCRYPRL